LGLARKGISVNQAARLCGLAPATVHVWFERPEPMYLDFQTAWKRAKAELLESMAGLVIEAAVSGEWRAALAILERRDPARWARHPRPQPAPSAASSATIEFYTPGSEPQVGAMFRLPHNGRRGDEPTS
jgi:hypothetical protein